MNTPFHFPKIAAVCVLLCAAAGTGGAADDAAARSAARQILADAREGYVAMHRQVPALVASVHTSRELSGVAKLPEKVRGMVRADGSPVVMDADGLSPYQVRVEWVSDMCWDRATGNSVVQTSRVRHEVNGVSELQADTPTLYCSLYGLATGHFSVIKSSTRSEADDSATQHEEDLRLIRDFTALTDLEVRQDRFLDRVASYLDPGHEGRNQVAVAENGPRKVVEIAWPGPDGSPVNKLVLSFGDFPFGKALTSCEQGLPGRSHARWTFGHEPVPTPAGASVVLPVRAVFEQFEPVAGGEQLTVRTVAAVRNIEVRPEPFTRESLRAEAASRYGVQAAEVMEEILRTGPVPEANPTMH